MQAVMAAARPHAAAVHCTRVRPPARAGCYPWRRDISYLPRSAAAPMRNR